MSGVSRSLPTRPSLRYLRLEAKRRLAAGEFPALHEAQAAIAREHGLPSWAALKRQVCAASEPESHALTQLRWLIARFSGAEAAGWTAPDDNEMRAHFDNRVLAVVPAAHLAGEIVKGAADLRSDLVVIAQGPLHAHVQLAGVRYLATVDDVPPYRLLSLQGFPIGARIRDTRLTTPSGTNGPPPRTLGPVPAGIAAIADDACAELGLAALVLAGGDPGGPPWVLAKGWADLDRAEVLGPGQRFPAPGVSALVTATAVLRLVAGGRIGLDARASDYLTAVRLGNDAITVADLLSHTAGVDDPAELYGDHVPDLAALIGPVVPCHGRRGEVRPSNGGYAVLGQLIADVTGTSFAQAVTRLVLDPLGLRDSGFPARTADIGEGAVSGYSVTADGTFAPVPARICTIQAAGGLWSTGADLVRLGTGWPSLLPPALAREALIPGTPRAGTGPDGGRLDGGRLDGGRLDGGRLDGGRLDGGRLDGSRLDGSRPDGAGVGLGWLISADGATAVHQGMGLDGTAALANRVRDNRTHVVLTNRSMTIDTIQDRLRRSWTDPSPEN